MSANTTAIARHLFKRAFSLIETAIVLGVVGLVIGGIWVAAATVNDNMKYKDLLEGVTFIVDQTQSSIPSSAYDKGPLVGSTLWIQAGSYTTLGIGMGLVPAHWVKGTNIYSPYGGVSYINASNSSYFTVSVNQLPRNACIKLIGAVAKHPGHAGGSVSPSGTMWGRSLTGFTIAYRQSGCSAGNNNVNLYFDFNLH